MTARTLAILACRIFSLSIALRTLPSLQQLLRAGWVHLAEAGSSSPIAYMLPTTAVELVLLATVSYWLWTHAEWLAQRMLPGGRSGASYVRLGAHDVHVVAVSIVGLAILAQTIPDLARTIVVMHLAATARQGLGSFNNPWMANVGIMLLKAGVGAGIWLRARWVVDVAGLFERPRRVSARSR